MGGVNSKRLGLWSLDAHSLGDVAPRFEFLLKSSTHQIRSAVYLDSSKNYSSRKVRAGFILAVL
jgi:hypothetical protein